MATLKELIAAHAADMGDDYPAMADMLNAPTSAPNLVTEAPTVAQLPSLKEIYATIPIAEAAQLYGHGTLAADVRNSIDSGDPEYMGMMLAIVAQLGIISPATAGTVGALMARTVTVEPPATIAGPSLAQAAGLGVVTAAQVQSVLNGGA